jgi:hypothetical protein
MSTRCAEPTIAVTPQHAVVRCTLGECSAPLDVSVDNCTGDVLELGPFGLGVQEGEPRADYRLDDPGPTYRLGPGARWTTRAYVLRNADYTGPVEEKLFYSVRWKPLVESERRPRDGRLHGELSIRDPAYERARLACDLCNGSWSAGRRAPASCRCRTSDPGRECHDGSDCQGQCIPTGQVELVGDKGLGYRIGKCSEFVSDGRKCGTIPVGAAAHGPYRVVGVHFLPCPSY